MSWLMEKYKIDMSEKVMTDLNKLKKEKSFDQTLYRTKAHRKTSLYSPSYKHLCDIHSPSQTPHRSHNIPHAPKRPRIALPLHMQASPATASHIAQHAI
jgi:hypothetical protein